jgi:hypothetical protein
MVSMSIRLLWISAVLTAFAALTGMALRDVGYWGIIAPHFASWGGGQVFADLVIACLLACVWMVGDARKRQVAAWPYVALTLALGSFGPLLYLAMREWAGASGGARRDVL